MSETGEELRENNEKIVKLIQELKAQRDEMNVLIVKQEEEKSHLETEIERITYKLTLIAKSLTQRLNAREKYDQTIEEAEAHYKKIVDSSGELLDTVTKEVSTLEESMDKKVGTEKESVVEALNPQND